MGKTMGIFFRSTFAAMLIFGTQATASDLNQTLIFDEVIGNTSTLVSGGIRGSNGSVRSLQGSCGNGNRGNGVCSNGQCCSQYGWCGTTSAHCTTSGGGGGSGGSTQLGDWALCSSSSQCKNGCCSSKYSGDGKTKCTPLTGGFNAAICLPNGGQGGTPTPPSGGTCGNGNRGNGVCANGQCCSQFGWCGTTSAHCNGAPAPAPASKPAPAPAPAPTTVLSSGSGRATYYYDVTGPQCGFTFAENKGYPTCTSWGSGAKTLEQYGTNKIVAIDNRLLQGAGRANLCGKEIEIFKDGRQLPGPFIVFDGCQRCADDGNTVIDLSVTALNEASGGNACSAGVVGGFSWRVTNKQIIPFVP